jgi:S-adenosylmethionine synthetase
MGSKTSTKTTLKIASVVVSETLENLQDCLRSLPKSRRNVFAFAHVIRATDSRLVNVNSRDDPT